MKQGLMNFINIVLNLNNLIKNNFNIYFKILLKMINTNFSKKI
jgi:hypothetical protein